MIHCHCVWAIALLWLGGGLVYAQAPMSQLPDSVSLIDERFFLAKEACQQLEAALQVPEENFIARDQALQVALQTARQGQDRAAEALIETELGLSCFRQDNYAAAFDWVNRCLSLVPELPPPSPLRQRIHLNVGGIYARMDAHRLALEQFKIALQIEELRGPQATTRRYRHCSDIAIAFQNLGQMDSAYTYYQRAIDVAQALPETIWASSSLNNLGMAYQKAGRYAEAMQLFQAADTKLVQDASTDWNFAVSVHDNLGHACIDLGRYEDAVAEFEGNLARIQTPHDLQSHIKSHLGLAGAYIGLGRLALASQEIAEGERILRSGPPTMLPSYTLRLQRLKIKWAEASGDWQLVAAAQEVLMHKLDSAARQTQRLKVGTLENLILDKTASFKEAIALSQSRNAALESRTRIRNLLYASGLVMLILFSIVMAVVRRRRAERAKTAQEQERYRRELLELSLQNQQLQNAQLNHALDMKQRDITDFAIVHGQRRKVFEEVLDSLKGLKRAPNQEQKLQELIHSFKGKMDAEGSLSMDAQHVELVNNAYFDKLRGAYPSLSPAELELCSMVRLGYSVKEIAAMRSIAPASVRIGKTRLKKKLDLGPDQDLTAFLKTF
jgi:tetratricopeptide (TPR) repeat protein